MTFLKWNFDTLNLKVAARLQKLGIFKFHQISDSITEVSRIFNMRKLGFQNYVISSTYYTFLIPSNVSRAATFQSKYLHILHHFVSSAGQRNGIDVVHNLWPALTMDVFCEILSNNLNLPLLRFDVWLTELRMCNT